MLRDIRHQKGMGLCELSRVSGVSTRTIQDIEQGKSSPTKATRNRLALTLGCRPEDIAPPAPPAEAPCTAAQAARIVALLNDEECTDASAA